MTSQPKAVGVIEILPFKAQVAVFTDSDELTRYYEEVLGILDHGFDEMPHFGMASQHQDAENVRWWSIFLPDTASLSTVVHECSHIVDFVLETHGVPLDVANTEIRAYTLVDVFEQVMDVLKKDPV